MKANEWEVVATDIGAQVIPFNDLRLHVRTWDCWCEPTDDDGVIVHHSKDQRELREPDRRKS